MNPNVQLDPIDYSLVKLPERKEVCHELFKMKICDYFTELNVYENLKVFFMDDQFKFCSNYITQDNYKTMDKILDYINDHKYTNDIFTTSTHFYLFHSSYFHSVFPSLHRRNLDGSGFETILNLETYNRMYAEVYQTQQDRYITILCSNNTYNSNMIIVWDSESKSVSDTIENGICDYSKISYYKNEGFFYTREFVGGEFNFNLYPHIKFPSHRIMYHKMHTKSSDDIVIHDFLNQNGWKFDISVTENYKYLIIIVSSFKRGNLLYYIILPTNGKFKYFKKCIEVVYKWKRMYKYLTSRDDKIYVLTDKLAPKKCIFEIDLSTKSPKCHCNWTMVLKGDPNKTIIDGKYLGENFIVYIYYVNGFTEMHFFKLDELKEFDTYFAYPAGYVSQCQKFTKIVATGNTMFYYLYESYIRPPSIKYIDFTAKSDYFSDINVEERPKAINHKNYSYTRLWYYQTEKFDTSRLMCIIYHKNDQLENKKGDCLVIVNGGFGEMILPKYDILISNFVEIFDAKCAIVNIPGGGEYGRIWHNVGKRSRKYKFIKNIENIIDCLYEKFTNRVILYGRNHGGLVAAACLVKIPNKLSCVLCHDALTDLIQLFMIDKNDPTQYYYAEEFGHPKLGWGCAKTILDYSPYQNVKKFEQNTYLPPTYCIANDFSKSWHTAKFIAELQYKAREGGYTKTPLFSELFYRRICYDKLPLPYKAEICGRMFTFILYSLKFTTFEKLLDFYKSSPELQGGTFVDKSSHTIRPNSPVGCKTDKECKIREQWDEIKRWK